jgi:DNA-binding NarL/FixJ family response regulator
MEKETQYHPTNYRSIFLESMKTKRTIRVVVADDHLVVRRGIVAVLSLNKEFEVVGEAADGAVALQLIQDTDPDVVIMDIAMPVKDGVETTQEIRSKYPHIKVLVLSGYDNADYVYKVLKSGANGYILKTTSPEELYAAIKAVYSDNAFFSPQISKILLDHFSHQSSEHQQKEPSKGTSGILSERECEVLKYIALGKNHQQIADELHISARTVDTHRNNIMRKTNLHDTASLVRYAIQEGIISVPHK